MSRALSPSFARCYGLARVARAWKISRERLSLSQRDAAEHNHPSPWSGRRMFGRGTGRSYSPAIDASRLHGEGYRKLWARLRFAGVSPHRAATSGDPSLERPQIEVMATRLAGGKASLPCR